MSRTDVNRAAGGLNNGNPLARLLESIDDVVWCMSIDGGGLLFVNSAAERIYGLPLRELTRKRDAWVDAVHPEDRRRFRENLDVVLTQGHVQLEYRIVRPDGEIRWLQDRLTVVEDAQGNATQIGGVATDITEHKQAEQALRESEAEFHSLVESLPLNVLRKDIDGRIVFANKRCCEALSRSPSEIIGKTDFELFPVELAKKYTDDDRTVLTTQEVIHDVEEHRTRDEETIFVEVLKGPVFNADGQVTGTQTMFWDVTDRKKAEEALDHERYLLHALLDNVPDSIYFKDTESRFIRINRGLAEKFRIKNPREAIGKTDADFFTEEHAKGALADEQELVQGKTPLIEKVEKETWRGLQHTWCFTTKLPLRDKQGKIIGTFGISRDITDQKRAEAELAQERDLLKTIINNVPDMIFVKDRAGRFVTANSALLRMLGLESVQELVGKTDYDWAPPELACNYVADDQIVMRTGQPLLDQEESSRDADGNNVWLLTTKVPLKNPGEEATGLVGIERDITSRKRTEIQLREAKDAADAANRAKSDFLANMSHEIRTPMNAIIGMTELLLDTSLTPTQRDYLRMVQESGEALLTVINDVLDFSKIEAGKFDLDRSSFNLRESLGDTMRSLAVRAHTKELELAFRVHPDVPNSLHGDVGRFRQIVVNLVGNAIKFTEQGEVVVDVSSQARTEDKVTLLVVVRDTGIGISESQCETIFEEFEQADSSTTRRFGGTGLGLAISSRLVEMMDGRIWVSSQLGKGSEFQFTITLDVIDPGEIVSVPVVVGGTRILIVDDNQTNRLILDEILTNWGMVTTQAESAEDALAFLQEGQQQAAAQQLVLTDVNMPDVDGFTLCEWIRHDQLLARTPIIMLTSGARAGDGARRDALNVSANLMKPVKQSELFNAIVRALGVNVSEDEYEPKPDTVPVSRPLKILLAEDNLVNQKLATGVLDQQGHSVRVVNNGAEAFDATAEEDFDLVLMDVQMPEMDGLEATKAIREREQESDSHQLIIAMTAHAMKGDRERCIEAGMDDYLPKPIRGQELAEKLGHWFGTGDHEPVAASQQESDSDIVDWDGALQSVGGSEGLLRDVVQAFLDDAPRLLDLVQGAVRDNDPPALGRAAHTLKGAMLFLHTDLPFSLAASLEAMGTEGDLSAAADTLRDLEGQMDQLVTSLKGFIQSTN